MNLAIFVMINIEMASADTFFWDQPLLAFNAAGTTPVFDCREDLFAVNFFKQVLTEFAVKMIAESATALVKKTIAKIRKQPSWKAEYELSKEIVWLLYFQAIIWIATLFFPYLAALSPLMMYVQFKYSYLSLK
jgi:hypothetical protein